MFEIFRHIKIISGNYELLLKLAAKEMKIRYKHPLLGFLWALIVPLCTIFIFKIIFSVILKVSFSEYPFFIFLTTAVFPWNFFSLSVSNSTLSIQDNSNLIKKVYFPREIIPISIIIANLINFFFTLLVILPIFIFYKVRFSHLIVFLPLVILLQVVLTIGVSLALSGLQARFRDIKYIVEILLSFWFYFTPVFYPLNIIANASKTFFKIYMLNPLAQIITLYRISLLDGYIKTLPGDLNIFYLLSLSIIISFTIFFIGFWVFNKLEPKFSDLV